MAETWIVLLGSHIPYHASAAWGPFASGQEAHRFAAFATREIDPADWAAIRAAMDQAYAQKRDAELEIRRLTEVMIRKADAQYRPTEPDAAKPRRDDV